MTESDPAFLHLFGGNHGRRLTFTQEFDDVEARQHGQDTLLVIPRGSSKPGRVPDGGP